MNLSFIYPNDKKKYIQDVERSEIDSRNLRDSGTESDRTDAATCFYPFYVRERKIEGVGKVPDDNFHPSSSNIFRDEGIIEIWPIDDSGNEKKWRYSVNSIEEIIPKLEIKGGRSNLQVIFNQDMGTMRSLWIDPKYDASEYGTKVLQNILGNEIALKFTYPKSVYTVMDCLRSVNVEDNKLVYMDYFAGSGTTAHAIINLNREDDGQRKYILVEMGEYFDTVLKPRIEKVIYSEDWKNGKPVSRKGSSHAFKYIKLELYEDTLNNLQLKRSEEQNASLFLTVEAFKEDYLLHYMLDVEARDSLLDLKVFETPFDYQLNIASNTVGETVPTKVDLVETFNYLIGLWVKRIRYVSDCVLVEGTSEQDGRVLVIWRDLKKTDNKKLESLFHEWNIVGRENAPEVIYVNGDNTLMTLRKEEQTWRVKLTEEEFHRRMFEDLD